MTTRNARRALALAVFAWPIVCAGHVAAEPPASGALEGLSATAKEAGAGAQTAATPAGQTPSSTEPAPSTAAITEPAAPATTGTITPAPATTATAATPSDTTAPATTAPATTGPAATTTAAPLPPSNPSVEAARALLSEKPFVAQIHADDAAALAAFYATRTDPLWIKDGAFTSRATALIAEVRKADDWGLEAAAFDTPNLASGADARAFGDADVRLSYAALKYARFARGGRLDPISLSNILDMKPPVKDPAAVLADLAAHDAPDRYLRELHPKYAQFEKLRQALLTARGPQLPEDEIDPALTIRLPKGKDLKPGAEHDDVELLRKRLKAEVASGGDPRLFDPALADAVKAYQKEQGIKATGILNGRTRTALNRETEPKKKDPASAVNHIIVNMERWRWLPEDPGPFYVINNIPEFTGRAMKGNEVALEYKIIIGLPSWPTPVMSAEMKEIVFHPQWGVPDGIKVKELLPRLRRASGGNNFFDQLFSGGSSGGARVLQAYKLNPSLNGRPVDANRIDWNSVDIRRFTFIQPAGATNPLGNIKFHFPNRHDVYMHDTPQRNLFGQSNRALSHGCIRTENPRELAELILAEDKGWSAEKVGGQWGGGTNTVSLEKHIPVYLTYFTARVADDGKLVSYADLYGHDSRTLAALKGRPVRYEAPDASGDMVSASAEDENFVEPAAAKKKRTVKRSKQADTPVDLLSEALSGLLAN